MRTQENLREMCPEFFIFSVAGRQNKYCFKKKKASTQIWVAIVIKMFMKQKYV